jgi:hypothetical protein
MKKITNLSNRFMKQLLISFFTVSTIYLNASASGRGGYLFAHMTNSDYGSLYYSVSEDGINWTTLNCFKKINNFRGHPTFCVGADGQYYMIGVVSGSPNTPVLWKSKDLINWNIYKNIPQTVFNVGSLGYSTELVWYGAPKMFYDRASNQYILSWHAPLTGQVTNSQDYWRSMRTFYVLTSDFVNYTVPKQLFNFTGDFANMATIDALIYKISGQYYVLVKDERWPGDIPNSSYSGYKSVLITKSDNLTGPFENPQIITAQWQEAPTLVPKPNSGGWYLYVEKYPTRYLLYEADAMDCSWTPKNIYPPYARHGSIIWIDKKIYNNVVRAFK